LLKHFEVPGIIIMIFEIRASIMIITELIIITWQLLNR